MEHEKLQKVMESAYEKWEKGVSYTDFLMRLDPNERNIVVLGNLNNQVENGGFSQWVENGYIDGFKFLIFALNSLGTEESERAREMVTKVYELCSECEPENSTDEWGDKVEFDYDKLMDSTDELDTEYYSFNEKLVSEAERAWT